MPSRCFEFVDSRLRRSPPDRASAVPMDKLGKRNAFPPPCPQVGGCPQASQQPQQRCDNFVSGNDQPSSRLPAFSLFFPGSCPNNRDRRSIGLTLTVSLRESQRTSGLLSSIVRGGTVHSNWIRVAGLYQGQGLFFLAHFRESGSNRFRRELQLLATVTLILLLRD